VSVEPHATLARDKVSEPLLVGLLHRAPARLRRGVARVLAQLRDEREVAAPRVAHENVRDECGEQRVRELQPAARRDAVGHVAELGRPEVVEGAEGGGAEDFRVNLGHAVDAVAPHDG